MNRIALLFLLMWTSIALAEWTPPAQPDPQKILREAQDDFSQKRYEDALAKHVWFHQNALNYRSSLYGVRLSFALGYWLELGKAYPPALVKLKAIRDDAEKDVRASKGARNAFHDFAAINKNLTEEQKTRELFSWLDKNQPKTARQVFDLAQPSLINAKDYRLCGKYIDPDSSYRQVVGNYRDHMKLTKDPNSSSGLRNFGEKRFLNSTTTLVALLVLDDRKGDAERIATEALKERTDEDFKAAMEKALKGEVPEPWP